MVGYEFEFIVREGNRPLSRGKFLEFHKVLQAEGWKSKYDSDTGGLTGSVKDGIYVTTDDGVGIMELNMPPTDTVQQSHERVSELLEKLQSIYKKLGCSIIGTSCFPGTFYVLHPECTEICKHPDCCEKSVIKYVMAQRFHQYHHYFFLIAANHIWLDLPRDSIAQHLWVFNRLSPILYALFANGPVAQSKEAGVLDWRDTAWQTALENSTVPHDRLIFGMHQSEHETVLDYFAFLMASPPYFLFRNSVSFKVRDKSMTMRDVLYSETIPATWGKGGDFETAPTTEDVFELQHTSFPSARLKFFLRDGLTLAEVTSAYSSGDASAFLKCFSKFCVEIRSVGAQRKNEVSVAPAFVLGLQENIEKIEGLLRAHPYEFWKELNDQVQKKGLDATLNGVSVAGLAREAFDISYEGLKKRGFGEETFIEPLRERISKRQNPAQELLEIWKTEGMEGVYRTRDF